ncbi:MAG: family 10 glycosylhydrolase [Chloroflexi bacterium]|nr:family 10 glycosylhydrolase [Chloroflexota bacterium]
MAAHAPELRALWVDAFHDGIKTPRQIDELVAWAQDAGFNTLYVQVRRRGDAYYLRSLEPRSEDPDLQPGFDALQYLLDRAHAGRRPLQVHAWLTTLAIWNRRNSPPENPAHMFNRHGLEPEAGDTWLMLRDDGEAFAGEGNSGTYYLDPGHPGAARHTADVYLQLLRDYDVDGIQLDQARYFEGGNGDQRRWGYNPTSVRRFNDAMGQPADSVPPPDEPRWSAWRRDQVTALVRRIYVEARAIKPRANVSCAVIAWGAGPRTEADWQRSAAYSTVFQDWRSWLSEGILDYTVPMNYYREAVLSAAWLDAWMTFQQANRGKRGVVLGLGSYLQEPAGLAAQLDRARAVGALGIASYSYAVPLAGSFDTDADARRRALPVLRTAFGEDQGVPTLPWLDRPSTAHLGFDLGGREDAEITLVGPFGTRTLRSDAIGFLAATDLAPGRYQATVRSASSTMRPFDVDLDPGQSRVVRLALA